MFATGALRNLNHMYAAQGSVDGVAYADNWTGFWMFVLSLVVIAAAWVAARPLVLAPIARLFGTVSGRSPPPHDAGRGAPCVKHPSHVKLTSLM